MDEVLDSNGRPIKFPISWQKAHVPLKVEKLNNHRFSIVAESNVTRGDCGGIVLRVMS